MTTTLGLVGFLGPYELVLLLAVALLLFSSRIPVLAKSVAQGLGELKRALLPGPDNSDRR